MRFIQRYIRIFFFPAVLLLMKSYQSHFPVICRQTHNLYSTFLFSVFFSVRIQCFRLCSRSFPIPTYNVPPPYTCRRDAFKHIACWDWFMDEFLNSTVWPEFCVSVVCAGFFFLYISPVHSHLSIRSVFCIRHILLAFAWWRPVSQYGSRMRLQNIYRKNMDAE